MNPPEEDYTQENPDENGWYDYDHLRSMPCCNPRSGEIVVPEDMVLETANASNGCSMLWRAGTKIYVKSRYRKSRLLQIDNRGYYVIKARLTIAPKSSEGVTI